MTQNLGGADRALRTVVGLFLLSLIFWGPQSMWGLIGLIPLFTAAIGWCPLYSPFDFSTRRSEAV